VGSVTLKDVKVQFDGKTVLAIDDLSLTAKTIAVIGANGSGKSTFARLLNGLAKPSTGQVLVNEIDVIAEPKRAVSQAGFIFSNPDVQIVMPTLIEDVEFSLRSVGLSKAEQNSQAMAALDAVGLKHLADAPAQSLSSGQKQLLAIAAITVRKPRLVIADEPTALLDLGNAKQIAKLLLAPVADQVVLVTHDMKLAGLCEVAVHFDQGRLISVGAPKDVIARYEKMFA
jgi:biotin transport system ATP-binding protein